MATDDIPLSDMLIAYTHYNEAMDDIQSVERKYSDLRHQLKLFPYDNDQEKNLVCLDGTIPTSHKTEMHNVPILIWFLDTHPYSAPIVFVQSSAAVNLISRKYVAQDGEVTVPYLSDWQKGKSDTTTLITKLCFVFGESTPAQNSPSPPPPYSYQCDNIDQLLAYRPPPPPPPPSGLPLYGDPAACCRDPLPTSPGRSPISPVSGTLKTPTPPSPQGYDPYSSSAGLPLTVNLSSLPASDGLKTLTSPLPQGYDPYSSSRGLSRAVGFPSFPASGSLKTPTSPSPQGYDPYSSPKLSHAVGFSSSPAPEGLTTPSLSSPPEYCDDLARIKRTPPPHDHISPLQQIREDKMIDNFKVNIDGFCRKVNKFA